jgi:arginine-tRNA-protein transferase
MQSRPIHWYMTAPQHCPYLEGREMQTVLVDPAVNLEDHHYGRLLAEGFRRSGQFVYRHQCPSCDACVPVRIPVDLFRPDRGQRRCLKRNGDLTVRTVLRPDLDEHMDLLRRYLGARHPAGGMENTTRTDYVGMLSDRNCGVLLTEFRLGPRLLAVAVTDRTPQALSAMYTFFDPDARERSLGTLAILHQVREARRQGLPHLYLGYWIPGSGKMAYKNRFQPVEGRVNGAWRRLPPD